jgi:hypothetical protein
MKKILILSLAIFSIENAVAQTSVGAVLGSEIKKGIDGQKATIGTSHDRITKLLAVQKSARELYESLGKLGKDCSPDFMVPASAMVPTHCTDSTGACASCYKEAFEALSKVRVRLAKLKCMGTNMKSFVNACNSFGDNASGIHAVTGLAWTKQKVEINKSYSKFKQAYDAKYTELIGVLNESLINIDKCEAQNGNPDWFQRFGFMYLEFMVQQYKRAD